MLKSGLIINPPISIITYFYGCLCACLFCVSLFYILRLCKSIEPALISLYFTSKESDFLEQYVSEGLFFFAAFSLISWISGESLFWTILESKISLCYIFFWHTHFTGPSVDPSTVHWRSTEVEGLGGIPSYTEPKISGNRLDGVTDINFKILFQNVVNV